MRGLLKGLCWCRVIRHLIWDYCPTLVMWLELNLLYGLLMMRYYKMIALSRLLVLLPRVLRLETELTSVRPNRFGLTV